MRFILTLVIMAFIAMPLAEATPSHINNSTPEAKAEQVTEVVQPTIPSEVPTPAPVAVVETELQPIGCEQYRSLLSQYDWNVNTMQAIMNAESHCNTYAVGDNYPINGIHAVSCGLLQIRTLESRPSCDQLKDPATNIAWGYKIYTSQGYKAWSVCSYKITCY